MSDARAPSPPFVSSVLLPTDFGPTSERAFAHALAIALVGRTRLTLLHAAPDGGTFEDWTRFPAVRRTLEGWGLLQPGSPPEAVFRELDVAVEKVLVRDRDPARAMLEFVRDHEPDLLVLATEARGGLPPWLRPSDSARVAFRTRTLSLFVPEGCRPFVRLDDGRISLGRILVPVAETPPAEPAVVYATRAAEALGDWPVTVTLLHAGDEPAPEVPHPEGEAWRFERRVASGDPVDAIVAAAEEADLVAMATAGREGVLDALRGSVTERVLRAVSCPVLAVPRQD